MKKGSKAILGPIRPRAEFFDFGRGSDRKVHPIDISVCVLRIQQKCDTKLFSGKYFHNRAGNEKQKRHTHTVAKCLEWDLQSQLNNSIANFATKKKIRSPTIQFYRDIDSKKGS